MKGIIIITLISWNLLFFVAVIIFFIASLGAANSDSCAKAAMESSPATLTETAGRTRTTLRGLLVSLKLK